MYTTLKHIGNNKVCIRRGRKCKEGLSKSAEKNHEKDVNKNYLHENEIYEKVDPEKDPDLQQLWKEKKDFFERLKCRFGIPFNLANETHFRSYKEARIMTRGDRDIIMKRLTDEVMLFQMIVRDILFVFYNSHGESFPTIYIC